MKTYSWTAAAWIGAQMILGTGAMADHQNPTNRCATESRGRYLTLNDTNYQAAYPARNLVVDSCQRLPGALPNECAMHLACEGDNYALATVVCTAHNTLNQEFRAWASNNNFNAAVQEAYNQCTRNSPPTQRDQLLCQNSARVACRSYNRNSIDEPVYFQGAAPQPPVVVPAPPPIYPQPPVVVPPPPHR